VGLPLAVEFARAGHRTTVLEVDAEKVGDVLAGRSYVGDVATSDVAAQRGAGRLLATTDASVLRDADVVSICVPTPLSKTRDPDLSYIVGVVDALVANPRPGRLVILESTTYPGTTEELLLPRLAAVHGPVGEAFFLAMSPERVDPGNRTWHTRNTPKLVGGMTPTCTELACLAYEGVVEVTVPVSSPSVAETSKLLENTFRLVNVGLVNELALMCRRLGISVWEVIEAAATKPFGFMPFWPGPGLGGHCIPVDPFYMSWKLKTLDYRARFIELAGEVSREMPERVVALVADALNDRGRAVRGSRVLVLGVAYKPDVADLRESPALDVIVHLRRKGAEVAYADPHVPAVDVDELGLHLKSLPATEATAAAHDAVVLTTHHRAFDVPALVRGARIFVDTRNAAKGIESPKVVRL
jgi:UDP-N-acetyl-D-glucosamine dehydrogenase